MAEDMKKNGGFIPGVKPGKQTASFIDDVMSTYYLTGFVYFLPLLQFYLPFAVQK